MGMVGLKNKTNKKTSFPETHDVFKLPYLLPLFFYFFIFFSLPFFSDHLFSKILCLPFSGDYQTCNTPSIVLYYHPSSVISGLSMAHGAVAETIISFTGTTEMKQTRIN